MPHFSQGCTPPHVIPTTRGDSPRRSRNTRLPCGIREGLGRPRERQSAPAGLEREARGDREPRTRRRSGQQEPEERRARTPPPRQPHPLTSMETRHPCMALNPKCSGRGPSPAPSPELFTVLGCDK